MYRARRSPTNTIPPSGMMPCSLLHRQSSSGRLGVPIVTDGLVWRCLNTRCEIAWSNPGRRCRGVAIAELDDVLVNATAMPVC